MVFLNTAFDVDRSKLIKLLIRKRIDSLVKIIEEVYEETSSVIKIMTKK